MLLSLAIFCSKTIFAEEAIFKCNNFGAIKMFKVTKDSIIYKNLNCSIAKIKFHNISGQDQSIKCKSKNGTLKEFFVLDEYYTDHEILLRSSGFAVMFPPSSGVLRTGAQYRCIRI